MIIFITFLMFYISVLTSSIYVNYRQTYMLASHSSTNFTFKIDKKSTLLFVQLQGHAQLTISVKKQQIDQIKLYQNIDSIQLDQPHLEKELIAEIQAKGMSSVGYFLVKQAQETEILNYHEQQFIKLKNKQKIIIQIHPYKYSTLRIDRLQGNPTLTSNLCKKNDKISCIDELVSVNKYILHKNTELIPLTPCSNCILLLQISSIQSQSLLRLSIDANLTILSHYPLMHLLHENLYLSLVAYVQVSHLQDLRGKLMLYQGDPQVQFYNSDWQNMQLNIQIQSNIRMYDFEKSNITQSQKKFIKIYIRIESKKSLTYFLFEFVSKFQTQIILRDGLLNVFELIQNHTYIVHYENNNYGSSQIMLSASSEILKHIQIEFKFKNIDQIYMIHPKFQFTQQIASQTFHIDQTKSQIVIKMTLLKGNSLINITSSVKQFIILPIDFYYSSQIKYGVIDNFYIEGLAKDVEIIIAKCVECQLTVQISDAPIYSKNVIQNSFQILDIFETIYYTLSRGTSVFLRVRTGNYAYYRILVRDKRAKVNFLKIVNNNVTTYISEDNKLELDFERPLCNQSICENVEYYLFEGSQKNQITTRAYCPQSLYDFDERKKDIILSQIHPLLNNEGILQYHMQMKQRDYLAILAKVGNEIVTYRVIDTKDIKLYSSLRWHIFHLVTFLTISAFIAFAIFMGGRRKKLNLTEGYIRVFSGSSMENFNEDSKDR